MNQEKIGKFIQSLRKEKKMTQQELANSIGVTDRAISKWENGRGMPDIMFLIPLAESLEISVLELLNGERNSDQNKLVVKLIKQNNSKIKLWKYLSIGILNFFLIFVIIMLLFGFLIPKMYENTSTNGIIKITSESMLPTFNVNDNIIYNKININNVKVNDIIVYYYVDSNNNTLNNIIVAHRVINIIKDENNDINLVTKGDNNKDLDINYVNKSNFIGVYNSKTNYLTNMLLNIDFKLPISFIIFLTLITISIIILDIIQIKYYLNRKH